MPQTQCCAALAAHQASKPYQAIGVLRTEAAAPALCCTVGNACRALMLQWQWQAAPQQAAYFMELNLARMASMTDPRSFLTGVGALAYWQPMPSISREWYATCTQRASPYPQETHWWQHCMLNPALTSPRCVTSVDCRQPPLRA